MSLALLRSLIAAPPVWFTILGVQTFIARPVPGHFLPELLGCVWTVCIALFAVAALVERRAPASIAIAPPLRDATPAPSPPEPPSGLQAHLPLKLRGAEIQALSAEDHYVRVHTDRGEHLILMRLSDAIATLPPDAGVRIHRSWWVAVRAVQHVERENRGARVALKTGAVARASRAGLSELRRLGFL
ncbi:MAG: LytTR family transcriptional regulator [Alphaproteobacteria bacterium]|nr:LytTR family transcriptional regulator [Alphaproteobacteria bacterium]